LFNILVSFCRTLAKFEAKLDANTLLLHVHHFNEKNSNFGNFWVALHNSTTEWQVTVWLFVVKNKL
jgi:hypothetical protein